MIEKIRENINSLRKKTVSKEGLLQKLNISEENMCKYISEMLEVACVNEDSTLVSDAVYLIFLYKPPFDKIINSLNFLIRSGFHEKHEDIAMLLQEAKSPSSIDALYETACAKYDYLAYDEFYALAVKCIWALGDINELESREKLIILSKCENEIIKNNAIYQLNRII